MRLSEVLISLLIFSTVTSAVLQVSFSVSKNSKVAVETGNNNFQVLEIDMKIRNCIHSLSFPYWKPFTLYEDEIKNEILIKLEEDGIEVLDTQFFSKNDRYFVQFSWKFSNKIYSTVDSISNYKIVE